MSENISKIEWDIESAINTIIANGCDTNLISDGYHTFGELYDHRIALYIALCRIINSTTRLVVWKSKKHSDGSELDGWFILGINTGTGEQITYHLPISKWDETDFAYAFEQAPEYDGHTSADVLKRLEQL